MIGKRGEIHARLVTTTVKDFIFEGSDFSSVITGSLMARRGGLMVSALDSGASGPGSSPGRGHCVVFLGKTLYSHSASLHPGV